MTALKEFERLECTGIWRATPEAQRRDVIVAVGDATLVISDQHDTALTHWSLPAVERINSGLRPALFRPGPDAAEILELDDEIMIQAINKVQSVIERRRPHPGRLRHLVLAGVGAAVLALALFWLPNAMVKHTAAVVPPATRLLIGHSLLENIRRVSGEPCNTALGKQALETLHQRLLGSQGGSLVVLSSGVQQSEHLPGGIVLLNRALVEDYEEPEVVAGFVLAEDQRARQTDPLVRLLQHTGLLSAFRLLTSGRLPKESLDAYGEQLLTAMRDPLDEEPLLRRFASAKVRASPYAFALDISGETTLGLIEADPVSSTAAVPVLTDGDWVGLQEICGE